MRTVRLNSDARFRLRVLFSSTVASAGASRKGSIVTTPNDPRVDDDLQAFLEWTAQQNRDGYTIANVMLRQEQFMSEVRRGLTGQGEQIRHLNGRVAVTEAEVKDLRTTTDEHGAALVAVKRRLRTGPQDEEMDTGVHQLAAIQARLAEQEQKRRDSERVKAEEQAWWKRSIIGWVAGAVGVIITSLVTVLITLAIANSAPRNIPPQSPSTASGR